jgi:hypothetical protein
MKRGAIGLALAAASLALAAAPAWSADSATVSMSVTPASACIQLNSGSSLNFGTVPFSAPNQPGTQSNPGPEVQNCSTATERVFARGTNASNGAGANWSLGGVFDQTTSNVNCSAGNLNKFDVGVGASTLLSTTDQELSSLSGGATGQPPVTLVMPCTGSSGAGTVMTWSVIFTAAF